MAINLKHGQQGLAVVYSSAPSIETPFLAAWMMAFASACTVETQCPSSITQPTSEQCGSPRIEPL